MKSTLSAVVLLLATQLVTAIPISSYDRLALRQLAGEGAACNSIFSSTDNGVGYAVEDAEDNVAGNIKTVTGTAGGTGGGPGGPPGPARKVRRALTQRQLDKIANGAGAIIDATGVPIVGGVVVSNGDSVDGTLTGGAAGTGATVGDTEASTLEKVGSSVPKQ